MSLDRIKLHIKENKKVYVACCVTAVATGAVVYYVTTKNAPAAISNNKITQVLSWKPKATIEVYVEALGDPGNIIQDTVSGTIYASQGQAARELGLNPARISEHLAGKIKHVNGHIFEKLGKAKVAE